MGYRNLKDCVADLRKHGHLIEIPQPVDAKLEAAEIHRRVYQSNGPALLFSNVVGCPFPMVSNPFGSMDRARFIFRDTFENVQRAIQLKLNPEMALKQPWKHWRAPLIAWQMQPKSVRNGPVMDQEIRLSELPGNLRRTLGLPCEGTFAGFGPLSRPLLRRWWM